MVKKIAKISVWHFVATLWRHLGAHRNNWTWMNYMYLPLQYG